MEKLKEFIWTRIINEIENSDDERLKNNIKAFKCREDLVNHIKFYSQMNFDDMKSVSSFDYWLRKRIYHVRDKRLLGNQTKAMPDNVYNQLIQYVKKYWGAKIALALEFEGVEGPRGEDVVRLKLKDFDFVRHIVQVTNRKCARTYEIPINTDIEKELLEYISKNEDKIEKSGGYIFFSDNPVQIRKHLSERFLGRVVRESLRDLGLNVMYARDFLGRPRYLYSLHSLRGHASSRVCQKGGSIKNAMELLDHTDYDTALLYQERNSVNDLRDIV